MQKVNLLPKENLDRQPVGKFLKWTLTYGRYIIVCVELIVFLVFFSRFIFDQKLADLNDTVEQKQAIVSAAGDFENLVRTTRTRIEEVKNLDNNRGIYLDILTLLKKITPIEVMYTQLTFNRETISITGEAISNESFAKLLSALKSDESFSEITLQSLGKNSPNVNDSNDESAPVSFAISAKLSNYPIPTPKIEQQPVAEEGDK